MYAGQLPRQLLLGARVVELGAGPGLPGLFAAACGAFSTITDLAKVTPLIEENIRANSVAVGNKSLAHSTNATLQGNDQEHAHNCKSTHTGRCVGEALQWGTDAGLKQAQVLGSRGVNYVIACDTCYIDPVCTSLHSFKCLATLKSTCHRLGGFLWIMAPCGIFFNSQVGAQ